MTVKIQNIPVIYDDKTARVADGSTAERPESPEAGMIRFNTDIDAFEGYDGNAWRSFYSNIIRTPVGTSPELNQEIEENTTFTLEASAYFDLKGITHASSDWQISTDPSFATTEVDISEDTSNLESYEVDGGFSAVGTPTFAGDTYYWRVRYRDLDGNVSEFSDAIEFKILLFLPNAFGQPYGGGIYMGAITAASQCYALIVAPNATGGAVCQWKTTRTTTSQSFGVQCVDGFANTYGGMNNATHPAGNFCATRTINGFSDWYLPAVNELQAFYNNGATSGNESVIGSGEAFCFGHHWSSTEVNVLSARLFRPSDGLRSFGYKNFTQRIRAVRRVPI